MRDYMKFAHKELEVKKWSRPLWVKSLKVSNVSWLLPSKDFPVEFLIDSNFLNIPTKYDNSLKNIKVDSLCNWKITEETPDSAIKSWYLLNFHSLNPAQTSWESAVQAWVKIWEWKEKYPNISNIITDYTDELCSRAWIVNTDMKTSLNDNDVLFIWKNNVNLAYKSWRSIIKIEVYLWDVLLSTHSTWNKTQRWIALTIPVPAHFSNSSWVLKFKLIDSEYYSYDENVNVKILATDNVSPFISINNGSIIKLSNWEDIQITWKASDQSPITWISYFINSILVHEDKNTNEIKYTISWKILKSWENILEIKAVDSSMNESFEEVKIIIE